MKVADAAPSARKNVSKLQMRAPKGVYLYRQTAHPIRNFRQLKNETWFAFKNGYGTEYGNLQYKFITKKSLKLLNLGKWKTRNTIIKRAASELSSSEFATFKLKFHPDYQYSGGEANSYVHGIIHLLFGSVVDGTYIHERGAEEDLEGASEIVLFSPYGRKIQFVKKYRRVGG